LISAWLLLMSIAVLDSELLELFISTNTGNSGRSIFSVDEALEEDPSWRFSYL